jgi:NAD(P)-dependent dehydrogenase (short-subunit alcohol dehydrogenase family)
MRTEVADERTSVRDRVAVVTGGGRGLGRAIATEFSLVGANVALFDIDLDRAQATASSLAATTGASVRAYGVDVSDSQAVDAAFARVALEFGRLDAVVNNAGVARVGQPIVDTSDEVWAEAIAVMQTGLFYCTRAAARQMLEAGSGTIVNISSIRGIAPKAGRVAYSAAKAAVNMITRIAAAELGPHGIRVNAVVPGFVRTEMWEEGVAAGVVDEQALADVVPARRIAEPAEVAKLVVFLCSDDAAYMNGSLHVIDGGATIANLI